ncbi:hypothetical protein IQ218_01095 [Synechocystis salina LEGE 06099]|uniref:hypothetical protein n=1 Tax=Synechocystis salina TaxID=945780 RepID=UPI00187F6728|nr:hypothetical protein [Synechocystis salina]MBE9202329.1 hypothetical protein [Synechocystis salina LEGE 06099]
MAIVLGVVLKPYLFDRKLGNLPPIYLRPVQSALTKALPLNWSVGNFRRTAIAKRRILGIY